MEDDRLEGRRGDEDFRRNVLVSRDRPEKGLVPVRTFRAG